MDFSGAWTIVDRLMAILKPAIDLLVAFGVVGVVVMLLYGLFNRGK